MTETNQNWIYLMMTFRHIPSVSNSFSSSRENRVIFHMDRNQLWETSPNLMVCDILTWQSHISSLDPLHLSFLPLRLKQGDFSLSSLGCKFGSHDWEILHLIVSQEAAYPDWCLKSFSQTIQVCTLKQAWIVSLYILPIS